MNIWTNVTINRQYHCFVFNELRDERIEAIIVFVKINYTLYVP